MTAPRNPSPLNCAACRRLPALSCPRAMDRPDGPVSTDPACEHFLATDLHSKRAAFGEVRDACRKATIEGLEELSSLLASDPRSDRVKGWLALRAQPLPPLAVGAGMAIAMLDALRWSAPGHEHEGNAAIDAIRQIIAEIGKAAAGSKSAWMVARDAGEKLVGSADGNT
jgi:hypothetical protein